jgi:hypothetical protein
MANINTPPIPIPQVNVRGVWQIVVFIFQMITNARNTDHIIPPRKQMFDNRLNFLKNFIDSQPFENPQLRAGGSYLKSFL